MYYEDELLEMKDILNRFKQDGKEQFLIEYIDRYQRIITPIIEKIRELSYSYQNVEFDGNDEVFRLIQEPYTVHDLEIFIKRTK